MSFDVLFNEMRGLGLNVELESIEDPDDDPTVPAAV